MVMAVNGYVFQVERRSFCYIRCLASPLCLYSTIGNASPPSPPGTHIPLLLIRYAVLCLLSALHRNLIFKRRRGERGQRWPTCFLHRWEFSCKASSPVPSFSHNVNLSGSRINNKEKALEITALVPVTISIESIRCFERRYKHRCNFRSSRSRRRVENGRRIRFDEQIKPSNI